MTLHFDILKNLDLKLKKQDNKLTDSKEDKSQLLIALIKTSDVSNVLRKFEVAKFWAKAIAEEFVQQGDLEKLNGLKVSNLMDRNSMVLQSFQIGFIDFVVIPWIKLMLSIIPEFENLHNEIQENKKMWVKFNEKINYQDLNRKYDFFDDFKHKKINFIRNDLTPRISLDKKNMIELRLDTSNFTFGEINEESKKKFNTKVAGLDILLYSDDNKISEHVNEILTNNGFNVLVGNTTILCNSNFVFDLIIIISNNFKFSLDLDKKYENTPKILFSNNSNKVKNFESIKYPIEINTFLTKINSYIDISMNNCQPINLEYVLELSGNDNEFLIELLDSFFQIVNDQKNSFQNYLNDNNFKKGCEDAQYLKTISSQLSCKPISRVAYLLENSFKNNNGNIEELITLLNKRIEQLEIKLK
jgi:HPt (histidine-containing phosphotransfer) domain-containing protein